MKKILSIALISYTLVTSSQLAVLSRPLLADEEGATPCSVNDPTGTPTNIRSRPNGKIIATIQNDSTVALIRRGEKWSEIMVELNGRKVRGYIFANYLTCG